MSESTVRGCVVYRIKCLEELHSESFEMDVRPSRSCGFDILSSTRCGKPVFKTAPSGEAMCEEHYALFSDQLSQLARDVAATHKYGCGGMMVVAIPDGRLDELASLEDPCKVFGPNYKVATKVVLDYAGAIFAAIIDSLAKAMPAVRRNTASRQHTEGT